MQNSSIFKILEFLGQIENLKSTPRFTKTKSGLQETVASHTWRMALMTILVAEELNIDVDLNRAIKLVLVHDLAESVTGDIPSYKLARGEVTRKQKNEGELAAIQELIKKLPAERGEEILNLWTEAFEQKTREAIFMKAMDRAESLLSYIEMGHKNFHDQHDHAAFYCDDLLQKDPKLLELLVILKSMLKDEFGKANIPWKKEYDQCIKDNK